MKIFLVLLGFRFSLCVVLLQEPPAKRWIVLPPHRGPTGAAGVPAAQPQCGRDNAPTVRVANPANGAGFATRTVGDPFLGVRDVRVVLPRQAPRYLQIVRAVPQNSVPPVQTSPCGTASPLGDASAVAVAPPAARATSRILQLQERSSKKNGCPPAAGTTSSLLELHQQPSRPSPEGSPSRPSPVQLDEELLPPLLPIALPTPLPVFSGYADSKTLVVLIQPGLGSFADPANYRIMKAALEQTNAVLEVGETITRIDNSAGPRRGRRYLWSFQASQATVEAAAAQPAAHTLLATHAAAIVLEAVGRARRDRAAERRRESLENILFVGASKGSTAAIAAAVIVQSVLGGVSSEASRDHVSPVRTGFIAINGLAGFVALEPPGSLSQNDAGVWKKIWGLSSLLPPQLGGLLTWNEVGSWYTPADNKWPVSPSMATQHANTAKRVEALMLGRGPTTTGGGASTARIARGEYNDGHLPSWVRTKVVPKWVGKLVSGQVDWDVGERCATWTDC